MYVEQDCVVEFEGKKFEAGGAIVYGDKLCGYLHGKDNRIGDKGEVRNWHGDKVLGTYVVTGRWATLNSYMASHMISVSIASDGKQYCGRSFGNGMFIKARLRKV